MSTNDLFSARSEFDTHSGDKGSFMSIKELESQGLCHLNELPFTIRILLESALRKCDGFLVTKDDVRRIASWSPTMNPEEIPFNPSRVILQDFTGVPAVVDIAALRDAMVELGGDPEKVNPQVPVDLVIDHSVQVDQSTKSDSFDKNVEIEFERNGERYSFLKWGQQAFDNFR
ncbi:MAG TPA: aconitate hydratase, partial [Candidatus Thalassarchaeaceae archaeon]